MTNESGSVSREVEVTFENFRNISANLEQATHEWATLSCCCLSFLARHLKEHTISQERFHWIKAGIEDLLVGLAAHERGPLAHQSFCGLYSAPVEVFGRSWTNYHEAAFNLHFCALQEIQYVLDPDGECGWHGSEPHPELHLARVFAIDRVTRSRVEDIARAFWKCFPIDHSVAEARFDWLCAALELEYDRVPPIQIMIVSLDPPQITILGTAYALTSKAAILLDALVKAREEWVNGHAVVDQPSRVVSQMPAQVRQRIESAPGKGFRLRRQK